MTMTLGQAAKHSGFSKPTLSRAIKSGKLSAARLEDGSYSVDPSELTRWIDSNGHRNSHLMRIATPVPVTETTPSPLAEIDALKSQIDLMRQLTESERRRAEAAERDRDNWHEQAKRQSVLLEDLSKPVRRTWFGLARAD
jgi:hypothetical protein